MWTALHWVKHNRPGDPHVDIEHIFNQQWSSLDDIVKGGAGKVSMYGERGAELNTVEFTCKPFNELFWDLWMFFANYLDDRRRAARKGDPGE